jgi:uncharacterized cupredoxin-like copper-binding protein
VSRYEAAGRTPAVWQHRDVIPGPGRRLALLTVAVLASAAVVACDAGAPAATPPIRPGASDAPREVNIIASDYRFVPPVVDLVPGETVVLHVINGGLTVHEAVLGDQRVQDAWEAAEAAAPEPPPGQTPAIVPPPDEHAGIRIVVDSGQRVDVTWTVPADAAGQAWVVGCHIPGHWERGMVVPIRFVGPSAMRPRLADGR